MARWFGKRDARYDTIVQILRDREVDDRDAREKRQRWYRQHLTTDAGRESSASAPSPPDRLFRFGTKVPCRATPEARALLARLRKEFSGSTVSFRHISSRRQAVLVTRGDDTAPSHIGWIEDCPQADPKRCNVCDQGLSVETDGGAMLVLRFRYPATPVSVSSARTEENDQVACVDFTEIRPALDLRPADKGASPGLVWITRPPEAETMNALQSREYEAFYARFKLEVLQGVWSSLCTALSSEPVSLWHAGSYYTVVRELDATIGRIHQKTIDDTGRAADIGADRIHDAFSATDILLLYLDADILADFTDIYFTLQSLTSADASPLKEELFAAVRQFWSSSQGLASRYGSDLPAVVRMSQRAVPMPAQIPLLKQDWTTLRQSLVDRFGEAGRKAADHAGDGGYRPRVGQNAWSFASFPAGEINVGLRLVFRQQWKHEGTQRGEAVRAVSRAALQRERRSTGSVVTEVVAATVEAMKWHLESEGNINTGVRGLAARSDMGLESECREGCRDTSARLSDIMRRIAGTMCDAAAASVSDERAECDDPADADAPTRVYRRVQDRYELLTRPAEIQNVVLIAEELPAPADIDRSWVRRHARVLTRVLLDECHRATLDAIELDTADSKRDGLYEHFRAHILHYQRAIWQHEDAQQRSMRYRKSGRKLPLEWRFELESGGALTIDELGDRLGATNVDGQFAAYSGGREAALDQVIDPSGPIGYYGNYAIYRMRPEFGSEDVFSMLHFFKSPYLRPNRETGEPEVADPEEIPLTDDLTAVDLLRRRRTRRIVLDSDRFVAEVKQSGDSQQGATEALEKLAGYQLIVDGQRGLERLTLTAPRDREAAWAIVRYGGDMPSLIAGAGGRARSRDVDVECAIRVDVEGKRTHTLQAGVGSARTLGSEAEQVMLPRGRGKRAAKLHAGRGEAPDQEPLVVVGRDESLTPNPVFV
jgi:hypothetical protein